MRCKGQGKFGVSRDEYVGRGNEGTEIKEEMDEPTMSEVEEEVKRQLEEEEDAKKETKEEANEEGEKKVPGAWKELYGVSGTVIEFSDDEEVKKEYGCGPPKPEVPMRTDISVPASPSKGNPTPELQRLLDLERKTLERKTHDTKQEKETNDVKQEMKQEMLSSPSELHRNTLMERANYNAFTGTD